MILRQASFFVAGKDRRVHAAQEKIRFPCLTPDSSRHLFAQTDPRPYDTAVLPAGAMSLIIVVFAEDSFFCLSRVLREGSSMSSSPTILLRLDPETRKRLQLLAEVTGWRQADLVAEAVRRFVDAEYDALLELQARAAEEEGGTADSPSKPRTWKITV